MTISNGRWALGMEAALTGRGLAANRGGPARGCSGLPSEPNMASSGGGEDDYAARMAQYGVDPKDTVAAAATDPAACWLDVRSLAEQQEEPMPKVRATRVQCPVWMDEASDLVANAAQLLPDKEAPIICFCAVGGRAGVAKSALEAAGYSSVINAGGLQDIQALASSLTAEGRLAGLGIELPELVPLGRYVPYVSLSAGVPPAALARLEHHKCRGE
jgi:phage shock protein E